MAGFARALGETFDAGAQHRFTTGGVEVEEVDAVTPEDARGPADGGGDVVELQVGEDQESLVPQGLEGDGAGLGVELEAHLGDAEPRLHALRHRERGVEVADVEREREALARVVRGGVGHASSNVPVRSRTVRHRDACTTRRARRARGTARGIAEVGGADRDPLAPASSISTASTPVCTPPVPMMGTSGTRARPCAPRARRSV